MNIPVKWVILKLITKEETLYKVLAGWSGSYLYGQSWQLNSGIVKVELENNYYLFHGFSGSIYKCYKNNYGFNNITSEIYESLKTKTESVDDVEIILLEDQDFTLIEY